MSIKHKIFNIVVFIYSFIPKIFPGYIGKKISAICSEKIVPIDEILTKYGKIKFYCFGKTSLWRSKTFFSKEPETIEWIGKMEKGKILWDIGANIGLYSIYAGKKGLKVLAFEPSAMNLFSLSKNIELNRLKDSVFLYPVAVSDKNEFGYLNMTSTDIGGALNEFSSNDLKIVGESDYKKKVVFKQGMFSYSIDEIIDKYNLEVPNYIKIDVDSIEDKIIYGANKTLSNKKLISILVELDETEERTKQVIDILFSKGLVLKEKRHSEMIERGKFKNIFNYIFWRKNCI